MTESEFWIANSRAINKRAIEHIQRARLAMQELDLALAFARDAMLTPLESAYAGVALDEVRGTKNIKEQ